MRKLFLRLFIACIMFCIGLGLTALVKLASSSSLPPPQEALQVNLVGDMGSDEQKLLEIYREYGPAQTRHDRAFFERVEADNFILFQAGRNLTREEDIRLMESWSKDIIFDSTVENIRFSGNTAVVNVRMTARYPNNAVQSWDAIDICIRNGDSWQILSTTSIY